MFRRRKGTQEKKKAAAAAGAQKMAAKENVRVPHRREEAAAAAAAEEGEEEDDDVMDRSQMKRAAGARAGGGGGGNGVDQTDDGDGDGDDDDEQHLRTSPRAYGDARETRDGYYRAVVRVENWAFTTDELTVPVGCILRFEVAKTERSMVEVTVRVTDEADRLVGKSPPLSAGMVWEVCCAEEGMLRFCDVEDADLSGEVDVVPGDPQTKFASHVAKKWALDRQREADQARRHTEARAEARFEADLRRRVEEKKEADADLQATLAANKAGWGSDTLSGENAVDNGLDAARQQAIDDSMAIYEEMRRNKTTGRR